jgi:hypothetical protein
MGTIAIIAIAACGLIWLAAIVEFSRTISELTRCRHSAGRVLQALGAGR